MVKVLIIALFLIIFFEIVFRVIYSIKNRSAYKFIKKVPFKYLAVKPHPYLPFILKRKFKTLPPEKLNYSLNRKYISPQLKTNNYSFLNGTYGNRDIKIPKPKNLIRINCLGGSTTQNYISFNNKIFSYPLELERILKKKTKKNIEVNNCGSGGYNSADILVRLILQLIDTRPNYIILYHAYNDIRAYLTNNFETDYSHSRKNLGEVYWKFNLGSYIPDIPLHFFNYIKNKILPSNHRHSLLDVVSKGKVDIKNNYKKGLATYERNIQSIIDICKSRKIKLFLCTFCFNLHSKVKKDLNHKLYKKIVDEENKILKKLAKENSLKLIDVANKIGKGKSNFVDTIHFSPEGMKKMATIISRSIKF